MKWRYLLWAVLPVALLLVLMWLNPHVSDKYFVQRVMPFIAMSLAKIILIAVLIVQHPSPQGGVPWWTVWRWIDPLVLLLVAMLAASTLYFVLLWGGNSQQFRAPDWGYTLARVGMLLDGCVLISVGCELLYRGVQSRKAERRRPLERYGLGDSSGGER